MALSYLVNHWLNSYEIDSQRQDILKWLQVTDPSPLHHRSQQLYEPGTGQWVLRSPDWINWLATKIRCLWIHDIPGAGKTILASYLIEKIKVYCAKSNSPQVAFAYYYCYHGHNQDEVAPFLRWMIGPQCPPK
jgi:hypothetical protein